MALRNLVDNQCGEGNPLMKLTNHVIQDKAHREYKSSWQHHHEDISELISHGVPVSPEQLVDEFISETKNATVANPQAFRMDSLLQEMQQIDRAPPILGPGVATLASEANTWAKEYFDSETFIQEVLPEELWTKEYLEYPQEDVTEKLWNAALASTKNVGNDEDLELAIAANKLLGTADDPKFSNTEFMDYMNRLGNTDANHDWSKEFISSSHSGGLKETKPSIFTDSQDQQHEVWQNEFIGDIGNKNIDSEQLSSEERQDFWQQLQNTWEKSAAEVKESDHPWFHEFEEQTIFKDYTFNEDNPLRNHPDPLSEGKKCLKIGDLPSAVLLFEAAVQKDASNSEAWYLLGTTHAENEQDPSAIPALRKCLEIDPLNLNGWMSLATSYTNESYQTHACQALKEWIKNNKQYKHLIGLQSEAESQHPKLLVATLASSDLVEEVQHLYLKAANLRLSDTVDPDVQCGLGTLLNLTGEYEKAVDCFQSAIQAKPNDARLWNKLGATLANSSKSTESIDAYRSALEISPGFIRCRYNLGVACINLGAHQEAMEHFLEALNMQERGRGLDSKGSSLAVSDNIWSTLRICIRSLDKQYLMAAVHNRDLETLNKVFGGNGTAAASNLKQ